MSEDEIFEACISEYQKNYSNGEYCHEQSFIWGYQEGFDYAVQELIKKVRNYIKNMDNIEKCLHVRTTLVDNLAEEVIKAMKE